MAKNEKRIKKILKSKFNRNVLLIAGGTAFAQIVNVCLTPIISRIYMPEEYGVLSVFIAIISTFSVISSLRYELAIPIAKNDHSAHSILFLCFIILILFVSFFTLFICFFKDWFLGLFEAEVLRNYFIIIPIGIFFSGLFLILIQFAMRKRAYKVITRVKVNQSITGNVTKIVLGLLGFGPLGLLFGQILKSSAGIGTVYFSVVRKNKILKKNTIKDLKLVAKRYKNFPLFSMPFRLLNAFSVQLPVFFISAFYGEKIVGFFGFANSIVNVPITLISTSVANVFYSEAANLGKSKANEIKKLSNNLIKKLFFLSLIPVLTLLFFGPVLFSFIFGENWVKAGEFARILSIMIFSRILFHPISLIYDIFEEQKKALILSMFKILMLIAGFFISEFFNFSSNLTIMIFSLTMSANYLINYFIAQRIMDNVIKLKTE
jgi:O-antigen/teichoic acid export membrane protein